MQYVNFDIETSDYKNEGGAETFKARVPERQRAAESGTLDPVIRTDLPALVEREFDQTRLIGYGKALANSLLTTGVSSRLRSSLSGLADDRGLRIRLKFDDYRLAELPWEYLYLANDDTPEDRQGAEGFLALNSRVSITRFETFESTTQFPSPISSRPVRFLACLANPKGTLGLNLIQERKNIETYLGELGEATVKPEFLEHATITSLQDKLRMPAHIFHFAGHGDYMLKRSEGVLLFETQEGERAELDAERIRLVLQGKGVRLVVLGACKGAALGEALGATLGKPNPWSSVAPALVRAGIPAVVGMQFKVADNNAIAFSRAFYAGLAAEMTVDEAVFEGRKAVRAISDDDERDWGTPVLYLRGDDDDVRLFTVVVKPNPQPTPPDSATAAAAALVPKILENPDVRNVVSVAKGTFETALQHLNRVIAYKDAHDLLQQVELQHQTIYEQVFESGQPKADIVWRLVKGNKSRYVSMLDQVNYRLSTSVIREEVESWLDDLGHARSDLSTGFDNEDVEQFSRAMRDIQSIFALQIPIMNKGLIEAVRSLEETGLSDKWQRIKAQISRIPNLDDNTKERFQRLSKAIDGLGVKIADLKNLRENHNRWQYMDDRFRAEYAQLDIDTGVMRLKDQWTRRLNARLLEFCGNSNEPWAVEMRNQAGKLDMLLAKLVPSQPDSDLVIDVKDCFFEIRSQATVYFNVVDVDLKNACGELGKLRNPLEEAVNQLS